LAGTETHVTATNRGCFDACGLIGVAGGVKQHDDWTRNFKLQYHFPPDIG
jgi:hypothetical protein